jgi:hypothetical protein
MPITIVIPTRERVGALQHAPASCVRVPDGRIEIVASDNASVDDIVTSIQCTTAQAEAMR